MKDEQSVTIKDLYPELTHKQQQEAEDNLLQYLQTVEQIHERLEAENRLGNLSENILLRRIQSKYKP